MPQNFLGGEGGMPLDYLEKEFYSVPPPFAIPRSAAEDSLVHRQNSTSR